MKNKTLLVVLGVLLVVVMGVSFAYFAVKVTIGGTGGTTGLEASNFMKVEYDAGTGKLEALDMLPKDVVRKNLKVIVTPTKSQKEVTYKIYMNITENTFRKCTNDNYDEATNKCEIDAREIVYRLKDSRGTIIKEGDLTGSVTGEVEIIRETKIQEVKTEYEYTIEIEYIDTGKEQNHNKNRVINGEIKVEFAEKGKSIPDIIAGLNIQDNTPDFSQIATEAEGSDNNNGIFKASDGMYGGTSYYWRGAATSNHVIFADKCWRIVRINGDKSMRLIYNGTVKANNTCTGNGANEESTPLINQGYVGTGNPEASEIVGWTYVAGKQRPESGDTVVDSNAKIQTESWFNNNIGNTAFVSKVADGMFCNDREVAEGNIWVSSVSSSESTRNNLNFKAYDRSGESNSSEISPILGCANSGDIYTLKAGAITMDEVIMAGAKYNVSNSNFYLYNGTMYWTMTPQCNYYNRFDERGVWLYYINPNGGFFGQIGYYEYGLRPVINLRSDTTFSESGIGTQDKPYVVL